MCISICDLDAVPILKPKICLFVTPFSTGRTGARFTVCVYLPMNIGKQLNLFMHLMELRGLDL